MAVGSPAYLAHLPISVGSLVQPGARGGGGSLVSSFAVQSMHPGETRSAGDGMLISEGLLVYQVVTADWASAGEVYTPS